jgi:hypothetical protein
LVHEQETGARANVVDGAMDEGDESEAALPLYAEDSDDYTDLSSVRSPLGPAVCGHLFTSSFNCSLTHPHELHGPMACDICSYRHSLVHSLIHTIVAKSYGLCVPRDYVPPSQSPSPPLSTIPWFSFVIISASYASIWYLLIVILSIQRHALTGHTCTLCRTSPLYCRMSLLYRERRRAGGMLWRMKTT